MLIILMFAASVKSVCRTDTKAGFEIIGLCASGQCPGQPNIYQACFDMHLPEQSAVRKNLRDIIVGVIAFTR